MAFEIAGQIKLIATERTGPAFRGAMRNMKMMAQEVNSSGRIVERSTGRMHSSMTRFMSFLGQQLTGVVRSFFYGLRMGVVGAGVAVSAFVVVSLKSFRDFDKKLRETTALIAGANRSGGGSISSSFKEAQKSYKDFYSYLLKTAPQMRRTPQEMAGGLYELVQAGLSGGSAKRLLRPAAKGATAGNSDVGSSARVLVQIMNALKMGTAKKGAGKQATNVMDQIFQAINLGVGVEFPTLATGIGKFIGSAGVTFKGGRKEGLKSLKDLMATYVFSTQQGARTQDVGVGIQDVIKTIANPSVKSKKFAKSIGLGDLGSTYLREHGFVGSLTTIIQKMKDAGYTGAKLNDAIGRLFADVRGRRIVAYAANLDMVKQAMTDMAHAGGAVDRSFKEQGRSMDAALQTFKSYYEVTKIALGGAAAPYVTRGANFLQGIAADAGVFGPGQDIADKAGGLKGKARSKYLSSLNPSQTLQYQQAQKFNKAGFGGKIKIIADSALMNFQAWWNSPQTQSKFTQMIHSLIQHSFDLLGRMIKTIPSIYKFGRRIAGEILRGVADGFKNSVKNVISSVSGGGGGGGGGGLGGNPLGGVSGDPFQAAAMGLLGLGVAGSRRGGSPLGRGGMIAAGATLAGLPPGIAALLGVGGAVTTFTKNRKLQKAAELASTGGSGAGARTVGTMHVQASAVYVNGAVGGGGVGVGALPAGYTRTGNGRIRGPNGRFVAASAIPGMTGGILPGGSPTPAAPPPGSPAARRFGFLRGLAGNKYARGGGMALANAGAAAAMGSDYGSAIGTGLGALGFLVPGAGPALGFATMAAGGIVGSMVQDHFFGNHQPKKSAGQSLFEHFMAPINPNLGAPVGSTPGKRGGPPVNPWGARFAAAKKGAALRSDVANNYGAVFGANGGFNVAQFGKDNKLGFGPEFFASATLFAQSVDKMIAVPFSGKGVSDTMQKYYEQAYKYSAGNSRAQDFLDQAAATWQAHSVEAEAQSALAAQKRRADKMVGKPHERPSPRDRNKGHKRGAKTITGKSPWEFLLGNDPTANMTKPDPKVSKAMQKAGFDPIASINAGQPSFLNGFGLGIQTAQKQAPQKMTDLFRTYTAAALAAAGNGGAQNTGPSSGAPPGGGGSGNRTFNNAAGNIGGGPAGMGAEGSAFGPAMMTAGGAMADKVSDTIANAVAKKQTEGPVGNAMKGLAWLRKQVGKPYIWGGGHPPNLDLKGYDCSGLASSALMAMGSKLAGTTYSMIGNTAPGAGLVQLGFNDPHHPSHMGIGVMGQWYEARGHATPILGPGKARTKWPYIGTPKFHSGGVYDSHSVRGEGPAILKDGEMVVRSSADGGLKAHPVVSGGGFMVNGPLIAHAEIRSAHDIHHLAQELVDLLEKKRANSVTAGTE